ncbi:HypC/HybG/HupF family hydrogenase formation chaperone [Candidatus Haliotispira prima]|uniref:HypC/HybG/HupF family hydrogenase formation chaperone n=1 Tax=Candidatus Haliotispira prima TaxID=3034016 RepID=A0ABY8MHS4_9SPIO|nr:HypC/HybG/HupF family hydrogenase formation chaperone [Candidatus Haliotispira prima]
MCVGIPGQIVGICNEEQQLVDVDISGIKRPVNVACVLEKGEQVANLLGDWVLVHVGFAMSRIDEQEAQETLALLDELGELHEPDSDEKLA